MNSVIICGRLTKDPEIRYTGTNQMAVARFTLAVDRRKRRDDSDPNQNADFIPCVAFDHSAQFAEKYFRQGTKLIVRGHIQTGSYTRQDGSKVYTTDIIVEETEFAESKKSDSDFQNVSPEKFPFM